MSSRKWRMFKEAINNSCTAITTKFDMTKYKESREIRWEMADLPVKNTTYSFKRVYLESI